MMSYLLFVLSVSVLAGNHHAFGTVKLRSGVLHGAQEDDDDMALTDAYKRSFSANARDSSSTNTGEAVSGASDALVAGTREVSLSESDNVDSRAVGDMSSTDAEILSSNEGGRDVTSGAENDSSSGVENDSAGEDWEKSSSDMNAISLSDAENILSSDGGEKLPSDVDAVSLSHAENDFSTAARTSSPSDTESGSFSDDGEKLSSDVTAASVRDAEKVPSSDAGEMFSSHVDTHSPSDAEKGPLSDANTKLSSVADRVSLNAKDEHAEFDEGRSALTVVPAWAGGAPDGYVLLLGKQPAKSGIATLLAQDSGILKTSGVACSKLCTNNPHCTFFQYGKNSRRCFLYDKTVRVLAGSNKDYAFFIKSAVPDVGIHVGSGRCLNSDTSYSMELPATNCRFDGHSEKKVDNCRTCCRVTEKCTGFSVSMAKDGGRCILYGDSPLMAENPRDNTESMHCFVRTETDAFRWPLTRAAHFRGCFTFANKSRSFDAKGWVASTSQCASACVQYDAFSISLGGYCVCELSDGTSDESTRVDDARCAGPCRRETALPGERRYCSTSDSTASALFHMSSVEDGSPCPEAAESGKRRYFVLRGNADAKYAFVVNETVASCSMCARRCDGSLGDSKCHGYTCVRRQSQVEPLAGVHFLSIRAHNGGGYHASHNMNEDDNYAYSFDCSLYRYPIPTSVNVRRSYMCAHQHNFDTSCAANYLHFAGFKYTAQQDTLALIAYKKSNACNDLCAKACNRRHKCKSYQCATSSDFCHLYSSRSVDSFLSVADVSLCVKIPLLQCPFTDGSVAATEECHCALSRDYARRNGNTNSGGMVCDAAQFCSVDEDGDAECLVRAKVRGAQTQ